MLKACDTCADMGVIVHCTDSEDFPYANNGARTYLIFWIYIIGHLSIDLVARK